MTRIIFIDVDSARHEVDATAGQSVMEAAIANNIAGIDADCGGMASCATCHIKVDEAWADAVGPRNDEEEAILGFRDDLDARDHLACQIEVGDRLEGMTVTVMPR